MNKKIIQKTAFMNKILKRYAILVEGDFEYEPGIFKHDIVAVIYPAGTMESFKNMGKAIEYLERGGLKEVEQQVLPSDVSNTLKNMLDNL